jgi:putative nucleotidyltransferase with HDIG domain
MQYNTTLLPAIPSGIAESLSLPDISFSSFEQTTVGAFWHSSLNQGKELSQEQGIQVLLHLLQRKSLYLYNHSLRVQYLASRLAHSLSLPQTEISAIELAALLHDTGKLLLSDNILQKAGKLTQQEFEEVKKHSVSGAQLLRGLMMPEKIISLVYHHHERWDGFGYPDGIAGNTIPVGARIITICDAFDAMTSHRPYHHPSTPAQAFTQLQCCAGTQFDSFLTSRFCTLLLFSLPNVIYSADELSTL